MLFPLLLLLWLLPPLPAQPPPQTTATGVHLSVEISANGLYSGRFNTTKPEKLALLNEALRNNLGPAAGGVRVLASPTIRFTRHWFAHSSFAVYTEPFLPYQAYHVTRDHPKVRFIQNFAGYTAAGDRKSLTVKAGKMITAFGAAASRYSDFVNPLIDLPQPNGSYLLLRPDVIACGNFDLEHQQMIHPNISAYHLCIDNESYAYGQLPLNPYGVHGAQVEVNYRRADARWQLANSSPSNPQSLRSKSQAPQWAGGAGVSLWGGVRVGGSFFRGPWLDASTQAKIQSIGGGNWRQYDARGLGIDGQYAHGRLSVQGEWMRLRYEYPHFTSQPQVRYAYAESKYTLTPRLYVASRIGSQRHNRIQYDGPEFSHHASWQPNKQAYDVGFGYFVGRQILFKFTRQWVRRSESYGPSDDVTAIQLATALPQLWRGFGRSN